MTTSAWVPIAAIADVETSRRCWEAIEEIERSLRDHLPSEADSSLSSGKSGLALFFAYLSASRNDPHAGDLALAALAESIESLGNTELQPALYNGFCGIGWSVEHLTRSFFEPDDELTSEIVETLREVLSAEGQRLPFELISGLAGWGVYLLERLPDPASAETLGLLVDHLERTAEASEAGLTWHTLPDWLPPWQREVMPGGCYNLGVAHGVPGVLGFLAAAQRAGFQDPRIPRLADGLASWILSQRLDGEESRYPAAMVPGKRSDPTRSAWCYGDPGIAAVLLSAARAFSRPDWEEEALIAARLTAAKSRREAQTIDAPICHGTVGLAHLFNRFYQATGEPAFAEAALTWYRHTLDLRRPGSGMGGFQTYLPPNDVSPGVWVEKAGFLIGVAGIGLSLLAAVSDVEPAWDRMMLTAIPPRAAEPREAA